MATLIFAGFGAAGAGAYRLHDAGSADALKEPELARAINDLTFYLLALSGVPAAVCLGAYAALVLQRRRASGVDRVARDRRRSRSRPDRCLAPLRERRPSLEGRGDRLRPATLFAWILAAGASRVRADPPCR